MSWDAQDAFLFPLCLSSGLLGNCKHSQTAQPASAGQRVEIVQVEGIGGLQQEQAAAKHPKLENRNQKRKKALRAYRLTG